VVLLLAALSLSALTTLLAAALSGLLLLLAWLLLAAAALLLARLVLTALLLAGILLVRIVHNFSYFDSSPVMTTILTRLGCSRFELNLPSIQKRSIRNQRWGQAIVEPRIVEA
jgi:hypothetical protein